jgi:HAD superfamily hydrolase (TIGR01549 family)
MNCSCIVFDYGGTLTHRDGGSQPPPPEPWFTGKAVAEFLRSKGRGNFDPVSMEEIAAAVNGALPPAGQTCRAANAERLVNWAAGIYRRIGLEHSLRAECEELAANYRWRSLQRGPDIPIDNRETLRKLRNRGYRLGALSNNDGYLEDRLIQEDVHNLFDAIADSANEGVVKPDPRIFQIMEQRLGAKPGECLYVGDDFERDVRGAHAAGWQAAYLQASAGSAKPENDAADLVIHSLRDLVNLLDQR